MRRWLAEEAELWRGLFWGVIFDLVVIITVAGAIWAAWRKGVK